MRADRLLSILMLLQHRGRLTAAEIATELEVSKRTVLRDIEALSTSGVPVYTDRGRGGGISLIPGYRTDLTGLTLEETKALLSSGTGRIASPNFASAMRKVAAALPERHRAEASRASQRILIRPDGFAWPSPPEPHLVELQRAVIEGLRVRVLYNSRNADAHERILDPIGLVYAGAHWYLLAERDGTERTYRVSRIEELTVLTEPATRASEVDLESAFLVHWNSFRSSLPKVIVACMIRDDAWETLSGKSLRILEHEVEPDGWSRAELEFAEESSAIRALWAVGPGVIALAPQPIRDELATRAAETAAGYIGSACAPFW
ncbi:helix-turn-helix transcriptional regulator [Rhodococcus sp. OK302]|uniref:helix-turn-helix transcriptional regulator n=1 Tax=Rhodococcus sp. OK302 TaxID=1882769 RepID=UPI000B942EF6|nr:YafY family protein [Rhodococcus sp. OK302]OYD66809.1 putative DNA-binding transcriptional regulator YafY [Rhodococcus sp. OK302]